MIPQPMQGGAPAKFARREVLNGILYVLRTGYAWRELPHDLPPWDTVDGYFRRWVIERSFAWLTRCRRLLKDYEASSLTPPPSSTSPSQASYSASFLANADFFNML